MKIFRRKPKPIFVPVEQLARDRLTELSDEINGLAQELHVKAREIRQIVKTGEPADARR